LFKSINMKISGQFFLYLTLILWGTLIGGIMYSHIVFFPPYLSHLPGSTALISGEYGLHDEAFWTLIHPVLILTSIVTVILNWKMPSRRKYILIAIGIYALAIISTFTYFVPELKAFADSAHSTTTPGEWLQRGQKWQYLSWTRGFFMYAGFVMLLIALTKTNVERNIA
jgi:hypothetical protein